MEIKTKFNIGDEVWFISKSQAIERSKITDISIRKLVAGDIEYTLSSYESLVGYGGHIFNVSVDRNENKLFTSKQELLNHLSATAIENE